MVEIISITELGRLESLSTDPRLPPFQGDKCRAHGCDAHLVSRREGGIVARCSLWWTSVPPHPGEQLGVIGHFAAADAKSSRELLEAAALELAKRGCTLAVGPMDGTTWRRYRLVTERGTEPPFLLEPDNPDEWPTWFTQSGFTPLARYFSALNSNLTIEDPRIPRTAERLEKSGIQLRRLAIEQFEVDLRRIYEVSRISFQKNFLYTPIAESEFLSQYGSIRTQVRPELVLLAEQEGRTVGYIFAIPDLAQARRGPIDTVILKTVAVLPGRSWAGLGNLLVARCQQAARALGFTRAIHALMHEDNNSLNLSGHYAQPFRRYTLFARDLRQLSPVSTGSARGLV
jgi:GNAT superfamily N-acetyltransferase